jgi:hypothetical protein
MECPEDVRRLRWRMKKIASTVRQITLMLPRTPPMIGPKDVELWDGELRDVSLVAGASDCEEGVSVVKLFEEPLDDVSLGSDSVLEIVIEDSVWVVEDDAVIVADTE